MAAKLRPACTIKPGPLGTRVAAAGRVAALVACLAATGARPIEAPQQQPHPEKGGSRTWTLAIGGDLMLNGVSFGGGSLRGASKALSAADLAIANLETPLTNTKSRTPAKSAKALRERTQYVLKADPRHAANLAEAGLDIVSLGNNHAMDCGVEGLSDTSRLLEARRIAFCGAGESRARAFAPAVKRLRSGLRVALLSMLAFRADRALRACTPAGEASPGVAALDVGGVADARARVRIRRIVSEARKGADVVFVSLHWGEERKTLPNAYQVALGRAFVDAGADAVFGHHPHVLQGAEVYRHRPIFYSLGNLVSSKPAQTAVFRLTFEGRSLVFAEMIPFAIRGGKVEALSGPRADSVLRAFQDLSSRLKRAYRHREAKPLPLSVGAVEAAGRRRGGLPQQGP